MKRRAAREIAFRLTYEMTVTGEFNPDTRAELTASADADSREYIGSVVAGVWENRERLKAVISKYAKGYDFHAYIRPISPHCTWRAMNCCIPIRRAP